tara:strand:+ start:3252 stop:3977 length:726 start_codon:yes stop_codon:yes gene_type:complete
MNVNDLSKFSLGQYGSVTLDSGEQLSLLGSSKYLIGAIHILSNRESSAIDNSFQYLVADDMHPLYWGTHFGGSMVLQFNGNNVSSANDTIKITNSLDWKYIRVGHTCNYWKRGQTDSSLGLSSYTIGTSTAPHSATTYYVVSKNENDKTIQLSTSLGGSPSNLTSQLDVAGSKRCLTFPAIVEQSTALIEDCLDADDVNHTAGPFVAGDNIVEGVILYGRWNFVRLGQFVRAVAYLIPKMI